MENQEIKSMEEINATYHRSKSGGGSWEFNKKMPNSWQIKYKDLTFLQWMFNQTSVEETLKYIDVEADFKSKVQVSLGL